MGQGVVEPNAEFCKIEENFFGRPVYRWLNPLETVDVQEPSLFPELLRNVDRHPLIVTEAASRQVGLVESLIRVGFRPVCSTLTLVLSGKHSPFHSGLADIRIRPGDLLDRQRWGKLIFSELSLAYEVDQFASSENSMNFLCDHPSWIARPSFVAEDVGQMKTAAMVVVDRSEPSVARLAAIFGSNASWSVVSFLIQETIHWLQEEDSGVLTIVMECDLRCWELIGLLLHQGFIARQTRNYLHWSDHPTSMIPSATTSSFLWNESRVSKRLV